MFSGARSAHGSRLSNCTSSSGADTPPLSPEDSSSQSEESQSSIDLAQVSEALSNTTHLIMSGPWTRPRLRARGAGHRRQMALLQPSSLDIYETNEEPSSVVNSPILSSVDIATNVTPVSCPPTLMADSEIASTDLHPDSDDDTCVVALRKFHALREEAHDTVAESKRLWEDTPFSVFSLQCKRFKLYSLSLKFT